MKEILLDSSYRIKIAINHYRCLKRKTVLIICPGCTMCKDAKPFRKMADDFYKYFDIITIDFRGHGQSTGLFTFTAKESEDLKTVVTFAKEMYPKIGIMGFSLGAATAIIYTAKNKDIHSLIAVSAPADFKKIENRFLKKEAVIPAIKKFEFGKSPNIRPGNIFLNKIRPIDVVQNIAPIPILFLSGTKDPIVYPWHTRELYRKAKEPKNIENFDNGLHAEELYLRSKDKFVRICKGWFEQTWN